MRRGAGSGSGSAAAAGCALGLWFVLAAGLCEAFVAPSSPVALSRWGGVLRGSAAAADLSGDGGVVRELLREGTGPPLGEGDIAVVDYEGKVKGSGFVFTQGSEFRCTVQDGTMISGWDIGLQGMRVGDEAEIVCTPQYGYGLDGVDPVIPPNSDLVFRVSVLGMEGNIMNPSSFADSNPLTPRSPTDIMAEFNRRQEIKAGEVQEEGLEGLIAWAKKIYIFGLFEGATGQDAPWYLKPLITFPLMIGICGVAFYAVLLLNGITTERGGTVMDDADLALLDIARNHAEIFYS